MVVGDKRVLRRCFGRSGGGRGILGIGRVKRGLDERGTQQTGKGKDAEEGARDKHGWDNIGN
jgi:hypothetical protein